MRRARTTLFLIGLLVLGGAAVPSSGMAEGTVVMALGAGEVHTCAVVGGGVQCWGDNQDGQLGNGESGRGLVSARPVHVTGLGTEVVTAVAAGESHSCAVLASGGVKCWGSGGQLGNGSYLGSAVPTDVVGLSGAVVAVSASDWPHTCALMAVGDVQCWGTNGAYLGGDCGTVSCLSPVAVEGLDGDATALALGRFHSCALLASGGVKCWGYNFYGELGNGTTTDSATPVDVLDGGGQPITDAVSIAASAYRTCLITQAGSVKCWGAWLLSPPSEGDGIIPISFVLTPMDIVGLERDVVAVAPGLYHACALMTGGEVKCWGDDTYGQQGNGEGSVYSTTPTTVPGLAGVTAIAAGPGGGHTCALLATGTVKCWGDNKLGQLGEGTTLPKPGAMDVLFDLDRDGCADLAEEGNAPRHGGLRNPKDFWDLFDTPGAANARDRAVSVNDLARIAARFGSTGDPAIDPLSPPPASGYHSAFDRSPPAAGADAWDAGPADGAVGVADITLAVAQFGHTCA